LKIEWEATSSSGRVILSGDILEHSCGCLTHFWDKHIRSWPHEVTFDMRQVESIDAESIAEFCSLLRQRADQGRRTRLVAPPQMLAHTLYKVASLSGDDRMVLEDPRDEEPYAG
jgi:ABC-type transporter Mla MlaB component